MNRLPSDWQLITLCAVFFCGRHLITISVLDRRRQPSERFEASVSKKQSASWRAGCWVRHQAGDDTVAKANIGAHQVSLQEPKAFPWPSSGRLLLPLGLASLRSRSAGCFASHPWQFGHHLSLMHAGGSGQARSATGPLTQYGDTSATMGDDTTTKNSMTAPARFFLGALPPSAVQVAASALFALTASALSALITASALTTLATTNDYEEHHSISTLDYPDCIPQ